MRAHQSDNAVLIFGVIGMNYFVVFMDLCLWESIPFPPSYSKGSVLDIYRDLLEALYLVLIHFPTFFSNLKKISHFYCVN